MKTKMLTLSELIEKFVESGLMVKKEIVEEIVKRDDVYEELSRILEDEPYWIPGWEEGAWYLIHTMFILGLKKSKKSFELLKYMLVHEIEVLGEGYWITEDLSSVFYSFGTEYFDDIKDIFFDESMDMWVRIAALDALCAFAVTNPKLTDDAAKVCNEFLKMDIKNDGGDEFLAMTFDSMAEVDDDELFERIKEAYQKSEYSESMISMGGLEELHKGTSKYSHYTYATKDLWEHFSDKNLNYLYEINYGKSKSKQ